MSSARRRIERARRRAEQRAARKAASSHSIPPEPVSDRAAVNQANSQHSTGPRSPEGKARSCQNARSHGLYARTLASAGAVLGEDPGAFEAMRESLIVEYRPEDGHEERMVDSLAQLWLRLDRLRVHAKRKLAGALDEGEDPVIALLAHEKIAVAEARLERSIARLHKDLLFLARYRKRARREDAKRPLEQRLLDLEVRSAVNSVQRPGLEGEGATLLDDMVAGEAVNTGDRADEQAGLLLEPLEALESSILSKEIQRQSAA